MKAFPARYPGNCHPCAQTIDKGDYILNHPQHGYIHEDCRYAADDTTAVSTSQDDGDGSESRVRTIDVMPRGRTAKDRCDRCFLVHTAAQGDECE